MRPVELEIAGCMLDVGLSCFVRADSIYCHQSLLASVRWEAEIERVLHEAMGRVKRLGGLEIQ